MTNKNINPTIWQVHINSFTDKDTAEAIQTKYTAEVDQKNVTSSSFFSFFRRLFNGTTIFSNVFNV